MRLMRAVKPAPGAKADGSCWSKTRRAQGGQVRRQRSVTGAEGRPSTRQKTSSNPHNDNGGVQKRAALLSSCSLPAPPPTMGASLLQLGGLVGAHDRRATMLKIHNIILEPSITPPRFFHSAVEESRLPAWHSSSVRAFPARVRSGWSILFNPGGIYGLQAQTGTTHHSPVRLFVCVSHGGKADAHSL